MRRRVRESLAAVAELTPASFEDLRRTIDPEWVLQALEATGTATVRNRRMPAEQVVWLVIGMALFRNRSIHDVVSKLDLARDGENRHWLIRAKKSSRWRVVQRLGPRDTLVELKVSSEARKKDPSLPKVWLVRAVTYQHKGFPPQTLLTSLLDHEAFPGPR